MTATYHPGFVDTATEACHVCGDSTVFGGCDHEDLDAECPSCGQWCDSRRAVRYEYLDYDHSIVNEGMGTKSWEIIGVWECCACYAKHPEEIRQCKRCERRYHVDVDEVSGGVCLLCQWVEEEK